MPQAPFKTNKRTRLRVMRLVASGMGERSIAHVLGICRNTLRDHFTHELEVGKALMHARINELYWTAADNGSVAAMNRLQDQITGERLHAGQKIIGKKEQQLEDARNAGGDEWGDLLKIEPQVKAN